MNAALADFVVVIHFIYIAVVVLGVPLILIGKFRHWAWVHNAWFRFTHLLMIVLVAFEAVFGLDCPLTVWENNLRHNTQNKDFIAAWLDRLLFYHLPRETFTVAYIIFALLVAALFVIVPVRKPSSPR